MKKSVLHQYIPATEWIRSYSGKDLKGDLNAGITGGILLIPQGMAYAVLAGFPPVYGLYASLLPLIAYAVFGTSRHLAIGPVAIVSLLVITGVGTIAEPGSGRFIQLAIFTALGVGIAQVLMGMLRMGFIVNFMSYPVLSGFTSAAVIIIISSQIGSLLGVQLPHVQQTHIILGALLQQVGDIHLPTAVIGIGSILLIILLKKWNRSFPAALSVVVLGTLSVSLLNTGSFRIPVVGTIPTGLPAFGIPSVSFAEILALAPVILIISLVGYVESTALSKTISRKHDNYSVDPNQELIGLGLAHIAGSFFRSFPVAGSFTRTAINDQNGGKTGMSSIISAALVAVTLLFLTPLFYYLPYAVLAAIIMVSVAGLIDIREAVNLWKTDKKDFWMLMITFIATISLGIEEGIVTGIAATLITVLYSSAKPHSAELGRLGESKNFRNINRYKMAETQKEVLIYRYDSQLYFANVAHFQDQIDERIRQKGPGLEVFILDASAIHQIDSTGIRVLTDLHKELGEKDIDLWFAGLIGPVRDKFYTAGLIEYFGKERFFFDVSSAVDYYNNRPGSKGPDENVLQVSVPKTKK